MKREGTIGAATFLALAAVVGFSLQSGPKQEVGGKSEVASAMKRTKPAVGKATAHEYLPGCSSLEEELGEFLDLDVDTDTDRLSPPQQCYEQGVKRGESGPNVAQKTSQLKFVIALLPDPVHTHLSVLFDQFAAAIQEGSQDEKYDFDSSWLPWDDADSHYALFADEKASNREKEERENQPGIILFRKSLECPEIAGKLQSGCKEGLGVLSEPYRQGLVVFVVGEEATHGIHRDQFQNALAWIGALQGGAESKIKRVAILGPTFSGSLPSLAQVLSEPEIKVRLGLGPDEQQLAIYSGSVSGNSAARLFQNTFDSQVRFHSFVQNDDEILQRFCGYIKKEQPTFDASRIAIISEDETAYGGSGVKLGKDEIDEDGTGQKTVCRKQALKLYYPRDISALRGAYQTKSLFDVGTSPQSADTQRRNLPSDLADPAGRVHDSIRSYGGNQTPLNQEAFLLEIVAALRELHARYIILRSSNTLDQLFLTNFLRRSYPDGRIVIFSPDLMFIRERGATGLSGVMTLGTYPLFPLERDWTEHQSLVAADRVFGSDTAEGTYVAFRLLLNDGRLNDRKLNDEKQVSGRCQVLEKVGDKNDETIFVPPIACSVDPPIPDYSPPFWTLSEQCGELKDENSRKKANKGEDCSYPEPATWLSVIGVNRFWPMASLTKNSPLATPVDRIKTDRADGREKDPGGRPEMPLGMKVFLLVLIGFCSFHAWCCWSGSYTAKPAFRAHFASTGERCHTMLVFGASCCVAFLAIVAGWGSGVFSLPAPGLDYPWLALGCMAFVCMMAWVAIRGNSYTAWKLSEGLPSWPNLSRMTDKDYSTWNYQAFGLFIAAIVLFYLFFVIPLQYALVTENRILTYWRAMHLASGVSPLVPIFSILIGLYLSFWFTLHGLALFGPDRPCLPPKQRLTLKDTAGNTKEFLKMFSQEDAARTIEQSVTPLNGKIVSITAGLFAVFFVVACGIARGVPVRSLGAESYSIIFLVGLDVCFSSSIVEAWRLHKGWEELRRLLTFLDRLPLRRTLAVLHGFSWGSVWKMSGNVLEVRYKVLSRQMECMNHTIASLEEFIKNSADPGLQNSLSALLCMRRAGMNFADWYSTNYKIPRAGNLTSFYKFQKSVAATSGTLLTNVLVPAWRKENESLIVAPASPIDEKEGAARNKPSQAKEEHIRNAEEFVCLTYLGFVQNVLGRLRTMAMTIVVLFLASTVAMSTYPFDPRQGLSAILIALFVITGGVIVKVYADMHRDFTLSHVTNTKPGELGSEFWFKIIGFGFAPLVGLLTRVFPGITDIIFSWLQPGISSLK